MSSPSSPPSPTQETLTESSATNTQPPALQSASDAKLVEFSVTLTSHTLTKTTSTGKGKVKKDTKNKNLSFSPQPENYLEFLCAVLSKFKGTDKVKISLRSVYPFAYYYKGVSKTSAPTVETKEEYREFVETLKAKKLEAVNLLVDMADVEAKCAKKSSPYDDSDSEPEDAGVGSAAVSSSSTKAIEEWITKLKTAHKGFYDPKIPGVQPLALTVFMYREWATYIIDHKATLDIPPNIPVFDPKSHHRSLVPSPMPATPSPSGSGLDLSQVTNLLAVVANMSFHSFPASVHSAVWCRDGA
ncbi:hypothetical protein LXA43DRAFT_1067980 [Ganoderma leucocontextum]|nr:hypothetical protein LXA43DRAFT_1067980 [Ganoderma leucocontextum]